MFCPTKNAMINLVLSVWLILLLGGASGSCQQDQECLDYEGKCVKQDECPLNITNVDCEPGLCGSSEDCTCMIISTPNSTESPTASRTARPSPRPTASPTPAPINCQQTNNCTGYEGKCVRKEKCPLNSSSIKCVPKYCASVNCTCMIFSKPNLTASPTVSPTPAPTPKPTPAPTPACETNDNCRFMGTGGVCVQDCIDIPGVIECAKNTCPGNGYCNCKHCLQNDKDCADKVGKCMHLKQCESEEASGYGFCDKSLCGSSDASGCACLAPTPSCPDEKECLDENGVCVRECQETHFVTCGNECQNSVDSSGCRCLKCNKQSACIERGGVCTPFCVAGPGEVCKNSLCDPDGIGGSPCACLVRV